MAGGVNVFPVAVGRKVADEANERRDQEQGCTIDQQSISDSLVLRTPHCWDQSHYPVELANTRLGVAQSARNEEVN